MISCVTFAFKRIFSFYHITYVLIALVLVGLGGNALLNSAQYLVYSFLLLVVQLRPQTSLFAAIIVTAPVIFLIH